MRGRGRAGIAGEEGKPPKASPIKSALLSVQRNVELFDAVCDQIEHHFVPYFSQSSRLEGFTWAELQMVMMEASRGEGKALDKSLPLPLRFDAEPRPPNAPPALSFPQGRPKPTFSPQQMPGFPAKELVEAQGRYVDLIRSAIGETLERLDGGSPAGPLQPIHLPPNPMEL